MTLGLRQAACLLLLPLLLAGAAPAARADSLVFCDAPKPVPTRQKDRLLRLAAWVKEALDQSGAPLALIARSGTDLRRFDLRYSHAGFSLRHSPNGPWSVRQLYFACDEGVPRLFDQGMSGFIFGSDNAYAGYLSVLLLPPEAAQQLAAAATDNRRALGLLAPRYSANAHAFALTHQNCNLWVAELLAEAWGALPPIERAVDGAGDAAALDPAAAVAAINARRGAAQQWLRQQGYEPHRFDLGWRPVVWLAGLLPWLHTDDHPADDLRAKHLRVSMPAELEAFALRLHPDARRLEFCHDGQRAVRRSGWTPITEGCQPEPGDAVLLLDD